MCGTGRRSWLLEYTEPDAATDARLGDDLANGRISIKAWERERRKLIRGTADPAFMHFMAMLSWIADGIREAGEHPSRREGHIMSLRRGSAVIIGLVVLFVAWVIILAASGKPPYTYIVF